jgi:hypothetical protein
MTYAETLYIIDLDKIEIIALGMFGNPGEGVAFGYKIYGLKHK